MKIIAYTMVAIALLSMTYVFVKMLVLTIKLDKGLLKDDVK